MTRAQIRAALPYVETALLLVAALVILGEEIEHHIKTLESWIADLGAWGLVAFVFLFVLTTSVLVPDTVLCIVAGALFGVRWGLAAVLTGSLLGGAVQFALSRRLLRQRIQRTLAARPSLAAIQQAVHHEEIRLQVLLRLTPLNPAMISYLLGAAGVRFSGFLMACLALGPNLFVEVYFGRAGRHVAGMAGGGTHAAPMQDLTIIGGLVVCFIVMVLVSRMARRAVLQAVAETEGTQSQGKTA